jgi:HNH endonuclease
MKFLQASKGYQAIVDDADFERISQFSWYAHSHSNKEFRPARREGGSDRKVITLVRELLGSQPKGMVIDHINGDPWDNRRENLRICTHAENIRNQRRPRKGDGSGKGVHPKGKRWTALIMSEGTSYCLGYYDDHLSAELAYDAAARFLHGDFACLNYPDAKTVPMHPNQVLANAKAADLAKFDAPRAMILETLRLGMNAKHASNKTGIAYRFALDVARSNGFEVKRGRPRKERQAT